MSLLFDENLSPRLAGLLAKAFPGCKHARECGLLGASDEEVWRLADGEGLAIVSKDSDFQQRSLLRGYPPKVLWLRIGNCTTLRIRDLILSRDEEIQRFLQDSEESLLVLS